MLKPSSFSIIYKTPYFWFLVFAIYDTNFFIQDENLFYFEAHS